MVSYAAGDLVGALRQIEQAIEEYEAVEAQIPEAYADRCLILLSAGLTADAQAAGERAVELMEHDRTTAAVRLAYMESAAAGAALDAGDHAAATRHARAAARRWGRAGNTRAEVEADFLRFRAAVAAGRSPARAVRAGDELSRRLDTEHSTAALDAHLLTGRLALSAGTASSPTLTWPLPPRRGAAARPSVGPPVGSRSPCRRRNATTGPACCARPTTAWPSSSSTASPSDPVTCALAPPCGGRSSPGWRLAGRRQTDRHANS
ncbi:MAG TPA: hypothetical protein VFR74_08490 [Jiangellales bacterium]|nr:hypothetical protein [Jiangellales bacterium]